MSQYFATSIHPGRTFIFLDFSRGWKFSKLRNLGSRISLQFQQGLFQYLNAKLKVSEFICKNLVLFKIHFQQVKPRSRFFLQSNNLLWQLCHLIRFLIFRFFLSSYSGVLTFLLFQISGSKVRPGWRGLTITSQDDEEKTTFKVVKSQIWCCSQRSPSGCFVALR